MNFHVLILIFLVYGKDELLVQKLIISDYIKIIQADSKFVWGHNPLLLGPSTN